MKKTDKSKKEQKPQGGVPKQPKDLTEQELEQVQGGSFSWGVTQSTSPRDIATG